MRELCFMKLIKESVVEASVRFDKQLDEKIVKLVIKPVIL
ncbi:hypothetical protein [Shigella phage SHSML-45]|uniref:Uncharacterized protein n=1 Tax=Shigella phage SHSML-45 TaxID=1863010 RepID=A0A193H1I5_9CAUD|nr:hypothetical protein BI056_gp048 [Shigella phage SHSML-45]ANN87114.1 hypothetical protein [Shigella phage SHSML-45]